MVQYTPSNEQHVLWSFNSVRHNDTDACMWWLPVQGKIRNQGRLTSALGQTTSSMKSYSADVELSSESWPPHDELDVGGHILEPMNGEQWAWRLEVAQYQSLRQNPNGGRKRTYDHEIPNHFLIFVRTKGINFFVWNTGASISSESFTVALVCHILSQFMQRQTLFYREGVFYSSDKNLHLFQSFRKSSA